MGDKGDFILKQAERFNEKVPDRIKNRPTLSDCTMFYYSSFMDLSTERQMGFGAGPIPFSSIVQYSQLYDIVGEDFNDFNFYIREMDTAFLKLTNKTKNVSKKSRRSNK